MTKPTLVVLAAGIGSRYGGLKQIDPVGRHGEIVLDYSVYDAIRAGFGKIVFVIRREIEKPFKEVIEPHFAGRIALAYAFQDLTDLPAGFTAPVNRAKPWGTAHALYACRDAVREPFGVINADDFYGRTSYRILAEKLKQVGGQPNRYCLVAFTLRNTLSDHGTVSRGVCEVDANGLLTKVVERRKIERQGATARYSENDRWFNLSGDEDVSMNMWGFTPSFFGPLGHGLEQFLSASIQNPAAEYQLPTAVDALIHNTAATVEVLRTSERWLGVTYPEDKQVVVAGLRELVKAGVYPEKLWE